MFLVVDEALKQELVIIFPYSCAAVDRCLTVGLLMLEVL